LNKDILNAYANVIFVVIYSHNSTKWEIQYSLNVAINMQIFYFVILNAFDCFTAGKSSAGFRNVEALGLIKNICYYNTCSAFNV